MMIRSITVLTLLLFASTDGFSQIIDSLTTEQELDSLFSKIDQLKREADKLYDEGDFEARNKFEHLNTLTAEWVNGRNWLKGKKFRKTALSRQEIISAFHTKEKGSLRKTSKRNRHKIKEYYAHALKHLAELDEFALTGDGKSFRDDYIEAYVNSKPYQESKTDDPLNFKTRYNNYLYPQVFPYQGHAIYSSWEGGAFLGFHDITQVNTQSDILFFNTNRPTYEGKTFISTATAQIGLYLQGNLGLLLRDEAGNTPMDRLLKITSVGMEFEHLWSEYRAESTPNTTEAESLSLRLDENLRQFRGSVFAEIFLLHYKNLSLYLTSGIYGKFIPWTKMKNINVFLNTDFINQERLELPAELSTTELRRSYIGGHFLGARLKYRFFRRWKLMAQFKYSTDWRALNDGIDKFMNRLAADYGYFDNELQFKYVECVIGVSYELPKFKIR